MNFKNLRMKISMSKKARHVLGLSGGKDSAALAVWMNNNYPDIDVEYYFTDTGYKPRNL